MTSAKLNVAGLALISLLFGGCVSVKSYVDPTTSHAGYQDITRRSTPYEWQIATEFQRNGEHLPKVDKELQANVERVVRASGMAIPASTGNTQLKIVVNNIADTGAAAAKGFGTGLTLGLAGSTVADNYEMTATLTVDGKIVRSDTYKHALHTAVGNTTPPAGVEVTSPAAAFNKVIEQLVLDFLKEVQQSGALTELTVRERLATYSLRSATRLF